MRYFLLVIILLNSQAAFSEQKRSLLSLCGVISEFAEVTMESRQSGTPMSKLMEAANGEKSMESIIIRAYEKPRFRTNEMKQQTIENYRDAIYLACIKELTE